MSYTREQAEEVLRDWNTFHLGSSDLRFHDRKFLNHKFPQLPERGWLKHTEGALVFRVDSKNGYGVNTYGKWYTLGHEWSFLFEPQEWQPATKEEVQAMLEKEAERRGLVKGVETISLYNSNRLTIENAYDSAWDDELMEDGELWGVQSDNDGILLMKDGIWATPIDDLQERIDAIVQEAKEKGKNLRIKID